MQRYILIGYLIFHLIACSIALSDIAIVKSKDIMSYDLAIEGFRSIVKEKTIEFDMEGDFDKGLKIVEEIKRKAIFKRSSFAIFTIGMMASKLIQEKITDVPVIFCMVTNPAKNSLVNVKNIGGVSMYLSVSSQLSNLKNIVPKAKNIGVIYNPENSGDIVKEARKTANSLNISLIAKEIVSEKEVPDALLELIDNISVLWLIPDNTVLNRKSFKFISTTVMENRVPAMAFSLQLVKMGLPFSFYADEFMMGRQAGLICKKVLDGEIEGVLPVEFPKDICLAINLITMEKFGIKASQRIMDTAKVIYK